MPSRRHQGVAMDIVLVVLQGCVVIGAIVLGVRTWGIVGTVILVFGFNRRPRSLS